MQQAATTTPAAARDFEQVDRAVEQAVCAGEAVSLQVLGYDDRILRLR